MRAGIPHRLNSHRLAAAIVVASLSGTSMAGQMSVSSEIQGAGYPRAAIGQPAEDADVRGRASLDYDSAREGRVDFRGDLVIYASRDQRAIVDGETRFVWREGPVEIAGGLLRESWGRFANSELDVLGAQNTPFSLVQPEPRLSQPTVRTTLFSPGFSVDIYALTGHRAQPLPSGRGRLGFGVTTHDVAERGSLGVQAVS